MHSKRMPGLSFNLAVRRCRNCSALPRGFKMLEGGASLKTQVKMRGTGILAKFISEVGTLLSMWFCSVTNWPLLMLLLVCKVWLEGLSRVIWGSKENGGDKVTIMGVKLQIWWSYSSNYFQLTPKQHQSFPCFTFPPSIIPLSLCHVNSCTRKNSLLLLVNFMKCVVEFVTLDKRRQKILTHYSLSWHHKASQI